MQHPTTRPASLADSVSNSGARVGASSTPSSAAGPRGAARHTRRHRGGKVILLLIIGVVLAAGSVGGWLFLHDDGGKSSSSSPDIHLVSVGGFEVVIPASGELGAARQEEVVNKLESRALINWIVPEGTIVRKGDPLFRLADEEIRNRIKDAQDAVTAAEANLASAESNLAIRESAAASEIDRAELAIRLAQLALDAWEKGELPSRRNNLATAIETAEINYVRLAKKFEDSKKLLEDEHISQDEYERDQIAMIEARARLETARLDEVVFESYQRLQSDAQRKSDLSQATAERVRVQARSDAEIDNAKIGLETSRSRLLTARERLADLERQLTYCEVFAPAGGLVVYASSMESSRRGNNDQGIQVGSELRPNEPVIILPDTTQMIASLRVNEALMGQIRPGQRARVVSDALPTMTLEGVVERISVLAEQTGWRDPNRREYTVRVLLTNVTEEMGLKPSMRCRGDLIVDTVSDALHVPIQSVFRRGGSAHVFVSDGRQVEQRTVRTGRASELYVEVLGGLAAGDQVLLREPTSDEIRRTAEVADRRAGSETSGAATTQRDGAAPAAGRPARGQGSPGRAPRTGLAEGG